MSSYENFVPMVMNAANGAMANPSRDDRAEARNQAVERDNQVIATQQAEQERQRRNLLDQQQATARAQMGAWGVGGDGGSADAILDGMAQATAGTIAAEGRTARLRMERNRGRARTGGGTNLLDGLGDGLSIFQSFYGGGE